MLLAVLDRYGLMPLRIEGLARRVDDLDPTLVESAVQLPQCGLGSFQQGRTGSRRPGIDPGLQGIAAGTQFLPQASHGDLAPLFNPPTPPPPQLPHPPHPPHLPVPFTPRP